MELFFNIETMRGGQAAQFARQIEKLGYSALWYGEGVSGRDPFVIGAHLMANTEKLIIATSIVNVWKRSPIAMSGQGARRNLRTSLHTRSRR